jgi:hypothetical protein
MIINAASISGSPNLPQERYFLTGVSTQDQQESYDNEKGQMQLNFTYDTNMEEVFGSTRLTDPETQRLKVDMITKDVVYSGILALNGPSTVFGIDTRNFDTATVQLSGAWVGTVTFEGSNFSAGGGTYYSLLGINITTQGQPITTATTNGIYRFPLSGIERFQCRFSTATAGTPQVTIALSGEPSIFGIISNTGVTVTGTATVSGGVGTVVQKPTSSELFTYDAGLSKDALTSIDYWNPYYATAALGGGYQPGDTVLWAGPNGSGSIPQVYRCILTTSGITPAPYPSNTTYWVYDFRQNKSLISNYANIGPDKSRLRVEIDQDSYRIRVAEQAQLTVEQQEWDLLIKQDYELYALEGGVSNTMGISFSQGYSSSSYYNLVEIR